MMVMMMMMMIMMILSILIVTIVIKYTFCKIKQCSTFPYD